MPTSKFLNIDFYRVKVQDKAARTFPDLLDVVHSLPDGPDRAQLRSDDAIRLQAVKKTASAWWGEMLRIRMNEAPVKAKLSGQTTAIPLDDDEGIGEETAFFYHLDTGILLLQRNRAGVSASAFAKYIRLLAKAQTIEFECILKEDALNRIIRMQSVHTFEVHFAGVEDGHNLRDRGRSARTIYQVLDEFQAPNATIRLSVGRKRGTLRNVASAVTQLFGNQADQGQREVKKLLVIGSEGEDEERTLVDLFQDKLAETVTVEVLDGERLGTAQRYRALGFAWERNHTYLETHYANPGE
jgi:hypothetical protein